MTIGATDPIHFDAEAARSAGYADVVAPPNLLAAVVEWGIGTPEADLQPDGTPNDSDTPLGDPDLGLRVMGAGEEMELVNPVVGGTELLLESTLTRSRRSRPGRARASSSRRSTPSVRRRHRAVREPPHRRAARSAGGVVMAATLEVGDLLPPLRQSVSPFQLFRYSAVTWNPHRIHIDEEHARAEATAVSRCTRTSGPRWRSGRHRGPRPGVAHQEVQLPTPSAAVRADRPDLHRSRRRRRRRRRHTRAHRGEPRGRDRLRGDRTGRGTDRRMTPAPQAANARSASATARASTATAPRPWPTWPEPAASTSSPATTSPRSRC